MALYYEPKSIAPILQESARVQVPLLSQPSGLSQALPALGGVAEKGFQVAADREKRVRSLELAKRDYDNFLRLSPEEQSLPGNYEHGANAAMALGLPRPNQRPEMADPRLAANMQTGLDIPGAPIAPTKANMSGLQDAMKMKEARDARKLAAQERIDARKAAADTRKIETEKKDAIVSTGKRLPAPTVLNLNEGKNVSRLLPEVEQAISKNAGIFGPMEGRARGMNPYDKTAQTVESRLRTASQAFGRFMEGGVLRKEDEVKYAKMFPQLSDTVEVANNKLAIVRRQLAQKYNDDKTTMGKSGYDVSAFADLEVPASVFDDKKGSASSDEYLKSMGL